MLRPQPGGAFLLVGSAFVYGLNDARAFLGPLPAPWRVQTSRHPDQAFRTVYRYFNPETGILTAEDPRLKPHPSWERIGLENLGRKLTGEDPQVCDFFRNKLTGEVSNSDPRLGPGELAERGARLEPFVLV